MKNTQKNKVQSQNKMGFADAYLQKHSYIDVLIKSSPSIDLKYCIVIPCFNEPDILQTLECLYNCNKPKHGVEIIIIINSSEISEPAIVEQNQLSYTQITEWSKTKNSPSFSIHPIILKDLPKKNAGVGLARKIGMDEAIRRFNSIKNNKGIIISYDADTYCDKNYLLEIENYFQSSKNAIGCTIYFEHPLGGNHYSNEVYNAITLYEIYLRYYIECLRWIKFPYAFHTLGSCFAVCSQAYIKQGGMNKRQAGEDFYFLHKLFPLGNFSELTNTCVYPSPRISDRVVFGTGPSVQKIISDNMSLKVYHPDSFIDLKQIISLIPKIYKTEITELDSILTKIENPLKEFLIQTSFIKKTIEIKKYSTTLRSFTQRFLYWFDAFTIIKYLNLVHENKYQKIEVLEAIIKISNLINLSIDSNESISLLKYLRKKQKEQAWFI